MRQRLADGLGSRSVTWTTSRSGWNVPPGWRWRSGCSCRRQVAFPVARAPPIGDLGRPLADHHHAGIRPRHCALRAALRPAVRSAGQFPAQFAPPLDVDRLVDRLVRHPHLRSVRTRTQPGRICFGDHNASRSLMTRRQSSPLIANFGQLQPAGANEPLADARRPAGNQSRPPLLFTSRHTVDGARPRPQAISLSERPNSTPTRISSRSSNDSRFGEGSHTTSLRVTPPQSRRTIVIAPLRRIDLLEDLPIRRSLRRQPNDLPPQITIQPPPRSLCHHNLLVRASRPSSRTVAVIS